MTATCVRLGNLAEQHRFWTDLGECVEPLVRDALTYLRVDPCTTSVSPQRLAHEHRNAVIWHAVFGWDPSKRDSLGREPHDQVMLRKLFELLKYSDLNHEFFVVDVKRADGTWRCSGEEACIRELTLLIKALFLKSKPGRAAEAKWTGVAGAARFSLRLEILNKSLSKAVARMLHSVSSLAKLKEKADLESLNFDNMCQKVQGSIRKRLLHKALMQGHATLKSYLLIKGNMPLRMVLYWLFKYDRDTCMSPEDERKLRERYLFEDLQEHLEDPLEEICDTDGPNAGEAGIPADAVPPSTFMRWCKGEPIVRCLHDLEAMLLGGDFEEELTTIFGKDGVVLCFGRRALTSGYGEVWWRLYCQIVLGYPFQTIATAHPYQSAFRREKGVERVCRAPSCCHDQGFTEPYLSKLGDTVESQIVQLQAPPQQRTLLQISETGKCAIFQMECEHRLTKGDVDASNTLGAAKALTTISSDHIIGSAKRMLAPADNLPSRLAERQRISKKQTPVSHKLNGFVLFRSLLQKSARTLGGFRGSLVGNRSFRSWVQEMWGLVPVNERFRLAVMARSRNKELKSHRLRESAAAQAAAQRGPAPSSTRMMIGDGVNIVSPEQIVEGFRSGITRTSTCATVEAHAVGTDADTQAWIERAGKKRKRTCAEVGLCKTAFQSNWDQTACLHMCVQRDLRNLCGKPLLQSGDAMVVFTKIAADHPYIVKRDWTLIVKQCFKPAFSIHLQLDALSDSDTCCEAPTCELMCKEVMRSFPPLHIERGSDGFLKCRHSRLVAAMIVGEMNKGLRVWMSCCAYSHTTLSRMTPIEVRWQKELSCDKIQGDPLDSLDYDDDAADDADDSGCEQLQAELDEERIAAVRHVTHVQRRKKAPGPRIDSGIGNLDIPYRMRGNVVTTVEDGIACGRMSAMMFWDPPSASAQCNVHGARVCSLTCDVLQTDSLKQWLANGVKYDSASAHLANRPDGLRALRLPKESR